MISLIEKWRRDAKQYMRQCAESEGKALPFDRMAGCADGLREAAKELESKSPAVVVDWLIEWEHELRARGGEIGSKDFAAFSLAGKVGIVRREIQEQFRLVSIPGTKDPKV